MEFWGFEISIHNGQSYIDPLQMASQWFLKPGVPAISVVFISFHDSWTPLNSHGHLQIDSGSPIKLVLRFGVESISNYWYFEDLSFLYTKLN